MNRLREAEVALAKAVAAPEIRRKLGVTEQTNYLWQRGMHEYRLTASATPALWMSILDGMQPRLRQMPPNGPG